MVDPMTLMASHLVTIATDYRQSVLVGRIFVIDLCNSSYHTSAKSNHIVF